MQDQTEYRLVADIQQEGATTHQTEIAELFDHDRAQQLLEAYHQMPAGDGVYIQTRQVTEWARFEPEEESCD